METLTNPTPTGGLSDDPAAASRNPRWVNLTLSQCHGGHDYGDAKTTASCRTSSGKPLRVSFALAAPPRFSALCCDWIGGAAGGGGDGNPIVSVIAAHDDSVLLEMTQKGRDLIDKYEHFLYEAGGGRTPPSLSLLPSCYISRQFRRDSDALHVPSMNTRPRNLSLMKHTGVLRRGEGAGEVLVAQLDVTYDTAELFVLRPGAHDWVLIKRVRVVHHEGAASAAGEVGFWTEFLDAAVAVGRRFMCWVDYDSCFLLCDMAAAEEDENPKLWFVPLPVPPPETFHRGHERPNLQYCRTLAAAGPDAVRFVSVAPRCCCGGPGATSCERARFAFNVTTWTLTLTTTEEEPMVWVKDGVLDCDELWRLPDYGCLPRVALKYPIVSSDDPDIVWFAVWESYGVDNPIWMVEIDTRSKVVLSVVRSDDSTYDGGHIFPAKLHW